MIAINVAMEQDKIIELLNEQEIEGITFRYKEKKGIKLIFVIEGTTDFELAAKQAKDIIKAQIWGNILFFQATAI
ncbi:MULTISPECIES: hypothetical protein [Vagococcus]|uniref:Uncharacterized protein n=1 Tax=Vagococcus fluvialis bH819 TaxID=1255619 RepID=A0A1X6WLX2_9ENTE|nr:MULTISPECIES: hypothetical protein [Vagococcus]SLM85270.1 hypothetical protein FM121_04180 [Vagococcus fluvialis bH819]HCM89432.1 hypothetical protein [Vagococcus sp.]